MKGGVLVSIIAAMARNRVIGKDGKMPWHLPGDLKRFKKLTTGHIVIMGRKTYESIGKPLPNRTNIVVTGKADYDVSQAVVVHSLETAISRARQISECHGPPKEIFIIGGAKIYEQTMDFADRIYLTHIDAIFEGDTYFPEIDGKIWELTESSAQDERGLYYLFQTLKRKTPN